MKQKRSLVAGFAFISLITLQFANAGEPDIPVIPGQNPDRVEFMKTIERAVKHDLTAAEECVNACHGMNLAIKLTSNPSARDEERKLKKGYILEDVATWAVNFHLKSCQPAVMRPLLEKLIKAEEGAYKADEPGLCFVYLAAAEYYETRCNDTSLAEKNYDLAMKNIPEVRYEKTHSFIPEKFSLALKEYEQLLKRDPLKKNKIKQVIIMRVQQKAKQLNNVGNHYLSGVFEPVYKTGLREYEVTKAIEVYTKAIDLIPTWAEPYRGRAKAYELLGKFDLAKKDSEKAKQLSK